MFRNYIKIAVRNLWKHKEYTFINIAGLAVGIAVCFTIFLWIQDEIKHDRFHENSDRIYRALWDAKVGDNEWVIPVVPVPVGTILKQDFPEVEKVTNLVINNTWIIRSGDEYIRQKDVIFADPEIFNVFTFRFLSGSPENALSEPNSVVLNHEIALRYFGDQDPVGQTLELNNNTILTVTGVVEKWPDQSHFNFSIIGPISDVAWLENRRDQWGSASVRTYFLLQDSSVIESLQEKFDRFTEENVNANSLFSAEGNYNRYPYQPLTDIHLYSRVQFGMDAGGDIRYIYLFSIVGIFILLLACINFINLTTARSAKRMREIGLRKVMGSDRIQLIRQFLAESFMYVLFAVFLSILLTELALPVFNDIAGKQMQPNYFGSPLTVSILAGIALIVGLIAGGYPAFHLSGFMPIRALKGQIAEHSPRNRFRNGLVITQFVVSVTLIIGTIVVYNQLRYMQDTNLGFDQTQVVIIRDTGALRGRHDTFIRELESDPAVVTASATHSLPGYNFDSTLFEPEQPANYVQSSLSYTLADYNFVDLLGLNIVRGRNFLREFPSDSTAFLINEAAAKALGWENPSGKTIGGGGAQRGPVIGVVEDFHFESLHSEIKPLIIPFLNWTPQMIAVRLAPGQVNQQLSAIQAIWNQFVTNRPINIEFLDQNLQAWYENEQRISQLFQIFTILALFIACLGLFGLAAYTAQVRTKEIGVRKVHGASVPNLIGFMSKEFAKLVVIAIVIAVPISWLAMNKWLEGFAFRIELSWWIFLLAATLAMIVALLTVSYQAIKAALMNPVESLRNE
ncbi:MAG: ABC transporter permease [Balneolaceae bacterium]